ncbi:unnamed protein product [Ascophyllum nodosum]
MNDADQTFSEDLVVHATVTGFSDLIAAVKMADARKRTRGYLIKPIRGVILKWRSQKVLLHNASNKELGFMQYLPTLIPVSRSRQVELPAVGGGGSESSEVMPRNPKGRIHEGYATPWPRDEHGHYKHDRLPYPEYLDTLRRGWGACLVVFDEVAGADARFLRRIDCDAGTVIILLDEIHQRKIVKQSVIDEVEKQMMAGT